MVSAESVEQQLKRLKFSPGPWGKAEVRELPKILLSDEEIYECVNGYYEGGFALLVATNIRVLLIDKKPLNYLTVEDLRFDMINEIDYSHRMTGAQISISAGAKNLKFRSYNQPRLRKLINHVQHCIAETKKRQSSHQEGQNQHLEQINQQLQAYLLAQHQNQQELSQRLQQVQLQNNAKLEAPLPEVVRPSPQLADYLFAQRLMEQYQQQTAQSAQTSAFTTPQPQPTPAVTVPQDFVADTEPDDMYTAGLQEVFGKAKHNQAATNGAVAQFHVATQPVVIPASHELEVNLLRIACSKLPLALRNRKFGRPSFHAHSKAVPIVPVPPVVGTI